MPEPPDKPWQLELAWKYFEIHVTHRAAMLNYLLVTVGLLANAYGVLALRPEAPVVFLAATVFTFSFFMLDVITNRKIQNAKRRVRDMLSPPGAPKSPADSRTAILLAILGGTAIREDEGFRGPLRLFLRDPFWTTVIEGGLAVLFANATLEAFKCATTTVRAGTAAVAGLVLLIAWSTSVRDTLGSGKLPSSTGEAKD